MTKRNTPCLLVALLLCACGENREEGYRERTDVNDWILSTLQTEYYWKESLREDANRFAIPEVYFENVLSSRTDGNKNDIYSYINIDGEDINRTDTQYATTYGFEYYTTNAGNSALAARVLVVYKNSPAAKAGLRRGDWIIKVNDTKINTSNQRMLDFGGACSFTTATYTPQDSESGNIPDDYSPWTEKDVLQIEASIPYDNAFIYCDTVFENEGRKTGYVLFNKFTGAYNAMQRNALANTFDRLSACENLIVDLRYCLRSDIRLVTDIASCIAGSTNAASTFLIKKHNADKTASDSTILFDPSMATHDAAWQNVHFIVSGNTSYEAECLINGLKPYVKTILIGTKTAGKNAILGKYTYDERYYICPVVAKYTDKEGKDDYYSGFAPDSIVDERGKDVTIYEDLGNTNELLLRAALDVVRNGIASGAE